MRLFSRSKCVFLTSWVIRFKAEFVRRLFRGRLVINLSGGFSWGEVSSVCENRTERRQTLVGNTDVLVWQFLHIGSCLCWRYWITKKEKKSFYFSSQKCKTLDKHSHSQTLACYRALSRSSARPEAQRGGARPASWRTAPHVTFF